MLFSHMLCNAVSISCVHLFLVDACQCCSSNTATLSSCSLHNQPSVTVHSQKPLNGVELFDTATSGDSLIDHHPKWQWQSVPHR